MGLNKDIAEAIIREHVYRPISGTVVLIGRQTMFLSPSEAVAMAKAHGVTRNAVSANDLEIDRGTLQSGTGDWVKDAAFFSLFTDANVVALDHSDYEGAEIIHDLNKPLPDHLCGIADFVVDGSTLDNVFDAALTLRNLAKLLKPTGRLFSINAGSLHGGAYSVITPHWLLDYFVANEFADVKIHPVTFDGKGVLEAFSIDLDSVSRKEFPDNFRSTFPVGLVLLAERGQQSTTDRTPSQSIYRPETEWAEYLKALSVIRSSNRPDLVVMRAATKKAQLGYRVCSRRK